VTSADVSTPPRVAESIRPLSGYERLFWAVDRVHGFNFSIAVSFAGNLAHARWRAGFDQAQARHPFLDTCLNTEDAQAPFFVRGEGLRIPIAFRRRDSSTEWQRAMEAGYTELFDQAAAPLLRAVVLEDEQGCDLILTANHVVIDGVGLLGFIRDLLRALAGKTLPSLPAPPSAENRVAQLRPASGKPVPAQDAAAPALAKEAAPTRPARAFERHRSGGRPAVGAIRFSPEETALLLQCCRREQTTAGAALLAAITCALRELSPLLEQAEIHLVAPVDARPYLDNTEDFVLSIITARAVSTAPEPDLWTSARALRTQLAPFLSIEAIEATYDRVQAMLDKRLEASVLVEALIQGFGHDASLSNLKNAEFPVVPEGLTVQSVWGPSVLLGVQGEHFIGSATVGGALHLVDTSYTPVAVLLEAVRRILVGACKNA